MNTDENVPIVYCSRCGAEMKSNSRYCMKCGNLNYEHGANEQMRKYIKDNKKKSYQVGSGKFMVDNNNSEVQVNIANNTGNTILCFLINNCILIAALVISFLLCCRGDFSIKHIISSHFPLVIIILSVLFLYTYSLELIFIKSNKRWWGALIPFYNIFVLSDIVFRNKWLGLITFIPIVDIIYLLVLLYRLGTKFNYNGMLTTILFGAYLPIIGFGNHLYEGHQFVPSNAKNFVEKEYGRKKLTFCSILICFLIGLGMFAYLNYAHMKSGAYAVKNYYYVYAGKRFAKRVDEKLGKNEVQCYGGSYSAENGVYYFEYYTIGKVVVLPLYFLREPIAGYVKVVNVNGESTYYVSLGDSSAGFEEVLVDELTTDNVIEKYDFKMPQDGLQCKLKYYKN